MEKEKIKEIITKSLNNLVKNDDDILKQKLPKMGKSTEKERILNRELHETSVNHRFAFYIENELINEKITDYHVDIEYNRNFSDQKRCKIGKFRIPVRPDILVHKRMKINEDTPHLLVIEAKKGKTNGHDIDKVKCFMNDEKYNYKYGLTVSYAHDQSKVKAVLYFKNGSNSINTEIITVDRS